MPMLTFVETRLFSRLADEYLGTEGLLTLYPKGVTDSIPGHLLRKIKAEIDEEDRY